MKHLLLTALFGLQIFFGFSQKVKVTSPNQKVSIALFNQQNADTSDWYLKVSYTNHGKTCQVIPRIYLELLRMIRIFRKALNFEKLVNQSLSTNNMLCCTENAPNAAIRPMKWLSASKMQVEPGFLTSIGEV